MAVEALEHRLPPGDTVLGGLLTGAIGGATQTAFAGQITSSRSEPLAVHLLALEKDGVAFGQILSGPRPGAPCEVGSISRQESAPVGTCQAPPWESSGVSSRPVTGFVPAAVIAAGNGSVNAAASGLTLAQVVGVVQPTPDADGGERNLTLALGTHADNAGAEEFAADTDTGPGGQSSAVRARFDLGHPTTGPFPSNVFTVHDRTHNTGRRVHLPLPDCKVYVSDCEDLAVLNELDGFNLQPRLSVPFSGPIDVNSVSSSTVFLVSLGSTLPGQGYMPRGTVVGINQVVWDVETNALHVESDELLAQHTRFALIVTNGVRDADGDPVGASREFRRFLLTVPGPYKWELLDGVLAAWQAGVRPRDVVTASVFTTQSATAVLEKIRDQITTHTPEPADFLLGPKGERTVFPLEEVTGITWRQQTQVEPPAFSSVNLNLSLLRNIYPGVVGGLAFGKYLAPDYEVHPGEFIPAIGTRTGTPAVQAVDDLYFNLILPSGPKPAEGWPVALFGHGGSANKNQPLLTVAAALARRGIATLGIDSVGSGFGPLSTLTVSRAGGNPLTLPAGGRGRDRDGDNDIGAQEGMQAAAPRGLVGNRDGFRQTAVDLMQLVRVIKAGMDVDGDGGADLDPARVSYFGLSQGGNIGTLLLAVDPGVRAGVPNVPGSPLIDSDRLSANRRPNVGARLAARVPPLLNGPGITEYGGLSVAAPHFHDNLPLRDGLPLTVPLADGTIHTIQSPVVNAVAGAMAIQEFVDRTEWAFQSGSSVAYAPHLRRAPLAGVPARPVLVQFAQGDQTNPNPVTTALLRAGDLADRATFYRHDLAYAERPQLPTNPHQHLTSLANMLWRDIVLGMQEQIAVFFASGGTEVIHPEPAQFFEVPIRGPLPEDLNFIA